MSRRMTTGKTSAGAPRRRTVTPANTGTTRGPEGPSPIARRALVEKKYGAKAQYPPAGQSAYERQREEKRRAGG